MKKRMKAGEMVKMLKGEKVNTWFDLGIFIDRFRENLEFPSAKFSGSEEDLTAYIKNSNLSFLTFAFSVDGVSIEIEKYTRVFRSLYPGIQIHYIAGEFHPESEKIIDPSIRKHIIQEARAFNKWSLYNNFFFTRLERGSREYNLLIKRLWRQVLVICEKLGEYIEKENIGLLYLVNVNSNPGNVSLGIATALVSECMGIPVINNAHDYYWEGGNRQEDIRKKGLKKGPRDFFFTNAHLGEVFSVIEIFYPWMSRSWITVNINRGQSDHIISTNGHHPGSVTEIGTAVDIDQYTITNKRIKINTFYQFEQVLSRYRQILVSYSVEDVLENKLVSEKDPRPILISGLKTRPLKDFLAENIVFLQPTRIIARKRIEMAFRLVNKLFGLVDFTSKFGETENLKLTIIVTGPVADGHYGYFEKLITRFSKLVQSLPEKFQNKIFLAFLFSELDKEHFKKRFENPVGIPELYNISSLVLLPSKTEGRGLPIVEAAACGVPIFCRRYEPENVYSEVIGEHLPEVDRLRVIEFDGKNILDEHLKKIVEKVFFPHLYQEEILHNHAVVKYRYSLESLNGNIKNICYRLYLQIKPAGKQLGIVEKTLKKYTELAHFENDDIKKILHRDKRQYIPGFGRLSFMIFLKSLIDPSFFRVEEQYFRGVAMDFAREMLDNDPGKEQISFESIMEFYQCVDVLFRYREGEWPVRHDHSFSYRHRNRNYYPVQKFTIQEVTGLINMLFVEIIRPKKTTRVLEASQFFTDWNLALTQLTSSPYLAIDDRKILFERMKANVPMVIFAGRYVSHELEIFALQSIRSRLKLGIQEELTREILKETSTAIAPVYVFAQEYPVRNWPEVREIKKFIVSGRSGELKLLYEFGLVKIITVKQWCMGVHIPQLGEEALRILGEIREESGLIITHRKDSVIMSDILDIDRVHIGKVEDPITEGMLGIPQGSGFIFYVPAGLRATISYPTPIQTAKDFHEIFHGDEVRQLCEQHGRKWVMNELKKDAEENGSPLAYVVKRLTETDGMRTEVVDCSYVGGLYEDGFGWNGVLARTKSSGKKWVFETVFAESKPRKVTAFVKEFEDKRRKNAAIAWNGGYILNAELVGKLGLPETYIGSPLGLLISHGRVLSPPLFNKAALLVKNDGSLEIRRVNLSRGFSLTGGENRIFFQGKNRNPGHLLPDACFYDLMHPEEFIPGYGKVIVRMAGNEIKEVMYTGNKETVKIIPVGLTLSIPAESFPEQWKEPGLRLDILPEEFKGVVHAIEAGPLLLKEGQIDIDMEAGGWKTDFSIATQAARLDYTDMRGPKIAVGLDEKGNLYVLSVNGRIRESVGATHEDMAHILKDYGMKWAMGFDPGGSSTLVVNGKTMNISPYNSRYHENIFSLPPEPRAVSNAVIGYTEG